MIDSVEFFAIQLIQLIQCTIILKISRNITLSCIFWIQMIHLFYSIFFSNLLNKFEFVLILIEKQKKCDFNYNLLKILCKINWWIKENLDENITQLNTTHSKIKPNFFPIEYKLLFTWSYLWVCELQVFDWKHLLTY